MSAGRLGLNVQLRLKRIFLDNYQRTVVDVFNIKDNSRLVQGWWKG